jgi:hypothetical protein
MAIEPTPSDTLVTPPGPDSFLITDPGVTPEEYASLKAKNPYDTRALTQAVYERQLRKRGLGAQSRFPADSPDFCDVPCQPGAEWGS